MLLLIVKLGPERYAIETNQVAEVIPRVRMREVPHAPDFVVGLFVFRGAVVPVIDLRKLMWGKECELFLNTRIVLVRLDDDRLLGLMAEDVTDTKQSSELTNVETGIEVEKAPYLSTMGVGEGVGMVQLIDIYKLLDQKAQELLYSSIDEFEGDLQAGQS